MYLTGPPQHGRLSLGARRRASIVVADYALMQEKDNTNIINAAAQCHRINTGPIMMQIAKSFSYFVVLATAALLCRTRRLLATAEPARAAILSSHFSAHQPARGSTIPGTERSVHIAGNCYPRRMGQPIIACYNGLGKEIPGIPASMKQALLVSASR